MALIDLVVPQIGESITEVTLSQWLVEDGEYVEIDQALCEFESDKATLEFPAEAAGILIHVAQEDDDIEIGGIVARIDTSAAKAESAKPVAKTEAAPKVEEAKVEVPSFETYATGHPSPAAAKLMAENNIPASEVTGTGKDGRILKEDVLKAIEAKKAVPTPLSAEKSTPAPAKAETPKAAPVSTAAFSRTVRREKMSRMRRTIADKLVAAKNGTAMLTTFNEVDLTNVMALRKTYQERFVAKYGVKLGFMSIFAKACAKALMELPDVNAQIDGKEIVYHDFVDLSVAVSVPNGLVVPVIKNIESLQFHEIELKIKEVAKKARDGKLTLAEMTGGTFTITNGGIFGSLQSTPILNAPQSAVLGMHGIKKRPMVIDGEIKIRPMMYLALSYDHRIIDGSSAVTFLVKVIKNLEDPMAMMLDL